MAKSTVNELDYNKMIGNKEAWFTPAPPSDSVGRKRLLISLCGCEIVRKGPYSEEVCVDGEIHSKRKNEVGSLGTYSSGWGPGGVMDGYYESITLKYNPDDLEQVKEVLELRKWIKINHIEFSEKPIGEQVEREIKESQETLLKRIFEEK